ncbi:procathepsin L-like [Planococcus citri]|uniref:procathepsin L-like n=1 Tax=Planococcus citri TaxID=170843 RepID=UPI0031F7EEA1
MIIQNVHFAWKTFLTLCLFGALQIINSEPIKPSPHLDEHWESFKTRFNKTYHPVLENKRRQTWEQNYHMINKHNEEHKQGLHTYELEINHLADLNQRQYLREMVRLSQSRRKPSNREITALPHHNLTAIPEELDWRKEGFITEPENQEECGSCYAFSVAGCLQGQYFKTRKKIVNFSAQQLVDCSYTSGNLGCAGGSLRNMLKYVQSVGGVMLEEDYPYTAKQSTCNFKRSKTAIRIKTWGVLPPRDETALRNALVTIGPIAVSVNASPITFQLYAKGVYYDRECKSDSVNHAMLLVGYTKKAWILKNWWTEEWGEDGYMLLKRGQNACAIANYAAYATIL